ncbi:non-ribosomal peptide synthetase [Leptolyngbya sp. FACHB-321]|uniref:non-ribosomal peptide synthetase n=1 Tax=Leptolyngbya sp. FACHB-321 TaxID=2692807 RepID=UPI0018EFADFD|nr:non-ribosomal peptide synthetase [Leptolyngbya sp. FACHB-321]
MVVDVNNNSHFEALEDDSLEDDVLIFPMSFAQQRLWFLDQLIPDSALYNLPLVVRLQGTLDVAVLEKSLDEIVQRHESLRTTFATVDSEPVQVIASIVPWQLPMIELQHLSEDDRQTEVQRLAAADAQQPFDLSTGPLMRTTLLHLASTEHVLLLTMHHIVSDLWSFNVLFQELSALYAAFSQGKPSPLPELSIQYADFAQWQRDWLQGDVQNKLLKYWTQQLGGNLPILELPTDRPRPAIQTFRGATHSFVIGDRPLAALKIVAQREGATLFMTLLAAFKTLLYRYTGQDDILVGSPIANRDRVEIENLIGFFVNTLVLRTSLAGNPSFQTLLRRIQQVTLNAYDHQSLPFEQLVEALHPQRSLSQNPLFQVMFVFQNVSVSTLTSDLTLSFDPIESPTSKFDLTFAVEEDADTLNIEIEYSTDLFDAATIDRMAGHFQTLIEGIIANPNQLLSELPLLTLAEQQQLQTWNQTQVDYPLDICLHQWVEAQVERTPDAIAVSFEGQQLIYQELNQRANQLAHYLQTLGVQPDVLVGLCVDRSLEMVIGLLAILKAGGAYVPFDPSYPSERLAFMLDDAQVPLLLTQAHLVDRLPPHQAQMLCLDIDWHQLAQSSTENPESGVTADHLAYVIYTSGSTGKPKGAMNTHRGICNRLLWMQAEYQLTEGDRVLQKTPFSFDVSVWEFFWTLMSGACLVVARPEGHKDPAYLVQLIAAQQVTTLHFVPSMLRVFLEEPNIESCYTIRQVMCSGEALPVDLQTRFFERCHAQLHNLYGPTEAAVDVTFWHCQPEDQQRSVPIGRPIANTQMHILDAQLQSVPIGITGELYIGGVNVARGYLNRPALTAERFLPDPFVSNSPTLHFPLPTPHLYKTGDLARYRPDGAIDYLDRIDHQVKLRGFRIELGEIEAVLAQHPDIQEAVVVVQESFGTKRLIAYLVTTLLPDRIPVQLKCLAIVNGLPPVSVNTTDLSFDGTCLMGITADGKPGHAVQLRLQLPGTTEEQQLEGTIVWQQGNQAGIKFNLTPDQQCLLRHSVEFLFEAQGFLKTLQRRLNRNLRDFLNQKLPDYMVPDRFVLLRSMPLNANGKIDRRALPTPEYDRSEAEVALAPPQTLIEQQLAALWSKLLGIEQVSIQDNFFESGGNSLLAAQLIAAIRETFQVKLPVRCIFEQPTIAGLAQLIETVDRNGLVSITQTLTLKSEAILPPEISPSRAQAFEMDQISHPKHIFLTGATGFLGAFLLKELLQQTEAHIYCLVRAADNSEGLSRLQTTLEKYQLWHPAFNHSRIVPISGDLAQPLLGLAPQEFARLAAQIDTIYHNGADVNFFKSYQQLKAANVLGTQEVLRLACQTKVKPVHHISTISIFGSTYSDATIIREDELIDGHESHLDLGYSQSKWVAEKLVWMAQSRGLPVTVFRAGAIAGSSQTAVSNSKDFEFSFIRGCIQMGVFPDLGTEQQSFVPVDYVSQVIVHLSKQPQLLKKAFHLVHPCPIRKVEFFEQIQADGYPLKKLPYTQWRETLLQQEQTSQDNALIPFLPLYKEESDQDRSTLSISDHSDPTFDCQNTLNGLAKTTINCLPISQLLKIYLPTVTT